MITCQFCKKKFNERKNMRIADVQTNLVEVQTDCTHCGETFYMFTTGTWASLSRARRLIESLDKKAMKEAACSK